MKQERRERCVAAQRKFTEGQSTERYRWALTEVLGIGGVDGFGQLEAGEGLTSGAIECFTDIEAPAYPLNAAGG